MIMELLVGSYAIPLVRENTETKEAAILPTLDLSYRIVRITLYLPQRQYLLAQ